MPDQGSEGLLSNYLRNKRIKAALPYICGRVLDVGCGSGELSYYLPADRYMGIDIDEESLNLAKSKHPAHQFQRKLPPVNNKFDTIIAIAVIEHVDNPEVFLLSFLEHLTSNHRSRIVMTSPHPIASQIHYLGSRIGLFSRSGNEEHEKLLNHGDFLQLASACGLCLKRYQRFLLGMNQLAVYQKEGSKL